MKERYRLFLRRKSVYYAFDNTTKTFQSLKTKDEAEATRLLIALIEAGNPTGTSLMESFLGETQVAPELS